MPYLDAGYSRTVEEHAKKDQDLICNSMDNYKKDSLTLKGAVALGTGVMIGAGIFALLGQVAELSGTWFPYIFIIGAIVSGFSAYSYIKVSIAYPSARGIAMILMKAYGKTTADSSSFCIDGAFYDHK